MSEFRTRASSEKFHGRKIVVRVDEVQYPDGKLHEVEVVGHAGAVVIIAQPEPGQVVLVHQYRHATGRSLWEIPAGTMEAGENPATTAARELAEETGYRAKRLRKVWTAYSAPGFCEELLHFFIAEDLTPGETSFDEGEDIETRVFAVHEAWEMVKRNELPDAKTQIALAYLITRTD